MRTTPPEISSRADVQSESENATVFPSLIALSPKKLRGARERPVAHQFPPSVCGRMLVYSPPVTRTSAG